MERGNAKIEEDSINEKFHSGLSVWDGEGLAKGSARGEAEARLWS